MVMSIPTEPIGSIPRPQRLIDAAAAVSTGQIGREEFDAIQREALAETIRRFEETGSPIITDGEQTKPSFATYPLAGLENLAPDGVEIPFDDGHVRQLPRLTSGPFRYAVHAGTYTALAKELTDRPLKQAVISASAMSLIYPPAGIQGYAREKFIADLVNEAEADVRSAFEAGAHRVQIDFTEGRLSVKLDPSKDLLRSFVELNNQILDRFSPDERARIGIHTCPGGDQDSTHSADVDYAELLPLLFEHHAGSFYMQLASEPDPRRVLEAVRSHRKPDQHVFVGVIDPIDPTIETPQQVKERTLLAAEYIPVDRLGTTDDCGFSPFGDDVSTGRDIAFAKIRARIEGTRLAAEALGA